jgi:hypothetical protein
MQLGSRSKINSPEGLNYIKEDLLEWLKRNNPNPRLPIGAPEVPEEEVREIE